MRAAVRSSGRVGTHADCAAIIEEALRAAADANHQVHAERQREWVRVQSWVKHQARSVQWPLAAVRELRSKSEAVAPLAIPAGSAIVSQILVSQLSKARVEYTTGVKRVVT